MKVPSRKLPAGGLQSPPWLVASAINGALDGYIENITTVTLTPSATTTTFANARLGVNSMLLFSPRTANAAGALSSLYVSAKADGSFTLTHANTAAVDKTFDVVIIG